MGIRKDCNGRFGVETTTQLLNRWLGFSRIDDKGQRRKRHTHLFQSIVYGQFDYIAGDTPTAKGHKFCKASIARDKLNQFRQQRGRYGSILRRASLIKTKVMQHLMADSDQIELFLAYCNKMPVVDGRRLGLFCLDIDCHKSEKHLDAEKAARLLIRDLGITYYYMEPSTSGRGIHLYVLISWRRFVSNDQICDDVLALA